jgi:flagellar hook-associated protein 3 FlgL
MRITSAYAFESSVANLQKRQQSLATMQEQLTSGKRVQTPSDDPAAAAAAARAMDNTTRVAAQQRASDASKNDMKQSEAALGDAGNLLQQARDLVVSAGNGSYSDSDRATIVQQLRGLRTDLLAVANRADGTGRYLFGGQGSDTPPLVDTPAGVVYNGLAGQQQAASARSMPLTVDGRSAWTQTADPSNPGSTISPFDALDRTINQLATPGQTATQVAQTVSQGLGAIDAVSGTLSTWRSSAGAALNSADTVDSQLSAAKLDAQTQRSNAEDLDMVQAISDFQSRQSGYDAALKTYSMVQQMSLFQYLK